MGRFAAVGLAAGVLVAVCFGAGQAGAADVESACARTVNAYARAWDNRDLGGFIILFTDDASLDLGFGTTARGRSAIASLFTKVSPAATTRHLMSNIIVTPTGLRTAEGVSYVQLFTRGPTVQSMPLPVESFTLLGEYHDRFDLSASGCRFVDRKLVTVFRHEAPPTPRY